MCDQDFGSIDLADQYETASEPQFAHGRDLLDLLSLEHGERVLDVGCGTGRLATAAGERVGADGRVVGIDPAAPRIEVARRHRSVCAEFHVGSAEDLSAFAPESFDVVYLNSVLVWLRDKPRALTEAYRVLRPGGRLGIATTVREPPNELRALVRHARSEASEEMADRSRREGTADSKVGGSQDRSNGRRITSEGVRDLLQTTAFSIRVFELRTYVSAFDDVAQIISFLHATTYGRFLANMTPSSAKQFATALERVIAQRIPLSRRTDRICLERHVLLAVAAKVSGS